MIEHHECETEFLSDYYPRPCRSVHARDCCRVYRQRINEYGFHAGTGCSPHRCSDCCNCDHPRWPGNNRSTGNHAAHRSQPGRSRPSRSAGRLPSSRLLQAAADAYMAAHPDADIQISGGGSGVGIQAIGAKTVDIGMSSREVTKDEMAKYPDFVITPVAQDGIAVIVNPANTIQSITFDQAQEIYLGKITKWSQITGADVPGTNNQIVVVGRDSASGTRAYFDTDCSAGNANPIATMQALNSNGAVIQNVAQTPLAIGYISIGFLSSRCQGSPHLVQCQRSIDYTLRCHREGPVLPDVPRSLYDHQRPADRTCRRLHQLHPQPRRAEDRCRSGICHPELR